MGNFWSDLGKGDIGDALGDAAEWAAHATGLDLVGNWLAQHLPRFRDEGLKLNDLLTLLARNRKLDPLTDADEKSGAVTTPLHALAPYLTDFLGLLVGGAPLAVFLDWQQKHTDQLPLGWIDTGYFGQGSGNVLYDVPLSTDNFYTLDLAIDQGATFGSRMTVSGPDGSATANDMHWLRIEVEPEAPFSDAHDYCARTPIKSGDTVFFQGPLLIDCHPPPPAPGSKLYPPFVEVHAVKLEVRNPFPSFGDVIPAPDWSVAGGAMKGSASNDLIFCFQSNALGQALFFQFHCDRQSTGYFGKTHQFVAQLAGSHRPVAHTSALPGTASSPAGRAMIIAKGVSSSRAMTEVPYHPRFYNPVPPRPLAPPATDPVQDEFVRLVGVPPRWSQLVAGNKPPAEGSFGVVGATTRQVEKGYWLCWLEGGGGPVEFPNLLSQPCLVSLPGPASLRGGTWRRYTYNPLHPLGQIAYVSHYSSRAVPWRK
jgi:hypothetical protein